MSYHQKNVAIILAGGNGSRFDSVIPKQFVNLVGKPIIEHSVDAFERHPLIDDIYVVIHKEYRDTFEDIIRQNDYKKIKKILIGGKTRQESSKIGVFMCENDIEKVLIHDAVRPLVSEEIITNVVLALDKYSSVGVAIPATDTIIEMSPNDNIVKNIPPRKYMFRNQTPHGFLLHIIKKAHLLAEQNRFESTNDCALVSEYGLSDIYIVNGSIYNMKITYPIDIHIADKIFSDIHRCVNSKSIG